MPAQNPNVIVLSVPTSGNGATAAATFSFFSEGYKPPRQPRAASYDDVQNQNGEYRYIYDNGPSKRVWEPFDIAFSDKWAQFAGGNATQQSANFDFLWQYIGALGLRGPEGTYTVAFSDAPLERRFGQYPAAAGDKVYDEMRIVVGLWDAS